MSYAASKLAATVRLGKTSVGNFTSAADVAVGNNPFVVQFVDFHNDGNADLITANSANAGMVSVALGNGNGTFGAAASSAVGSSPRGRASGEFHGDGKHAAEPGQPLRRRRPEQDR